MVKGTWRQVCVIIVWCTVKGVWREVGELIVQCTVKGAQRKAALLAGSLAGGLDVVLRGSGFRSEDIACNRVTICNVPCVVKTVSRTSISCTTGPYVSESTWYAYQTVPSETALPSTNDPEKVSGTSYYGYSSIENAFDGNISTNWQYVVLRLISTIGIHL